MTETCKFHALDVLCPMHLALSPDGTIIHAGPTLLKMDRALRGRRFLEVFDVRRPRAIETFADLRAATDKKLHLKLRAAPHTGLKGVVVDEAFGTKNMVVNLSFGISIVDGVRDYGLTNADFAATDLAIEMLYLIEAKTAAMEASYRLNARLQGDKIAAEEQAFTDTLTGLRNRRALDLVLERLGQDTRPFAIMQIDLDLFKAVNDTLGHAAGDFVLQKAGHIMVDETREKDVVCRVGGDEFTIIFPEIRNKEALCGIGHRIIERLEEPMMFEGNECRISGSIGTVWAAQGKGNPIEGLLADADVALYASKNAGRATQTFYTPELRSDANAVLPKTGRGAQEAV